MSRPNHHYTTLVWLGAALILAAGFIRFTGEVLHQPAPGPLDRFAIRTMAEIRSPGLTGFFLNWTALGSTTLICLHTVIAFALLMSTGDRAGAAQLAAASGGAFLLTAWTKELVERVRPPEPALIDVAGFSYPSGHSLAAAAMYVTMTILACRHLPTGRQRVVVSLLAAIVVLGIGVSRVYLGVHYMSDAISGIVLGTAWALALAGVASMLEQRGGLPGN
ncbi:MAG TPA: phosphatase PAP2 family protein [Terriglobia bacterium]|nr:phosphatase PAP2 family protein [Terriglobia bacterium]